MKKITLLILVAILLAITGFGQLSGVKTIPGDYATVAAAITDLNAVGVVPPGVTFNIAAGYTETFATPTAGLITATGTNLNSQIVFQKSGVGANPVITAASGGTSTTVDGIIVIRGGDYITFDGIDLVENAANTTATLQMEWGYAFVKASATDGAQYNTIKNCTITLNKTNTATAGIYSGNHTELNTTALTITAITGANSNNKFYGNTISNCFSGIYVKGFADVTPFTYYDQSNEIGVTAGNNISNYGGASTSYGIYLSNNNNAKINNNNISNTGTTSTLRGIYLAATTNANVDVINNNITLNSNATTSQCTGIESAVSGTTNTVNLNNNKIHDCVYNATSGAFQGIYSSATCGNINILNDSIYNNTLGGTGTMTLIDGGSSAALNMSNNVVINNIKSGASGTMYCTRASTTTVNYTLNQVYGNGFLATSGTSAASVYGYYNFGSPTVENYINNSINSLFINGASTSTTSLIYGIYSNTSATSVITATQNAIYGLNYNNSSTGSGTVQGIRFALGTVSVFKNAVFTNTSNGASSTNYGIYAAGGTSWLMYNNEVFDLKTPSANIANAIAGIYIAGGTNVSAYYNSIYLNASSTGALFGTSGIYASTTPTVDLRNNIVVNTSTPVGATGYTAAYRRNTTTLTSYSSSSNNNDFYAGVPSPNNLIFYDGTNTDQTLSAFQSRVNPSDAVSISEMPPFTNIVTPPFDLRLQTTVPTLCESGGQRITTPAITDDVENQLRWGETGYSGTGTSTDIGADEFDGIKPACLPPNTLNASAITTTSATLGWTAGGTETLWNLEWGIAGFTQGTGTMVSGLTANSYNLSGLTASTSYSFYVQADCGGTTSSWAGPFSFTTLCNNINTFPYVESFDGTTYAPMCWANVKTGGSGVGLWDRQTTGTFPTCTPHSGAAMSRYNSYSYTSGTTGILVTPGIDFPSDLYEVRFWMYRDNGYPTNLDLVNIYYNTAPDTIGATLLGTINRSNTLAPVEATANQWYEYHFNMPVGSTGIGRYVIFEGVSYWGNNIFVDDVTIQPQPTCIAPSLLTASNITTTSADLGWTENGTATLWNIEWGVFGFTQGTGTMVNGLTANTYNLTGLTAATNYSFYVQADCGGSTSTWTGPFTFTTACDAYNIPYSENFDGVTTPALPLCMSKSNDNSDTYLWNTETAYPNSAPNSMGIGYNTTLAMDDWFYTPGLNLLSSKVYKLTLSYRARSATYPEKLEVKYGYNANAVSMTSSQIFNDSNVVNTTYLTTSKIFNVPIDSVYFVGFHGYSNADMWHLYVDDISVTEASNANSIITFDVPTQSSSTVGANNVLINMPCGTDVTNLIPNITISAGATISPASGVAQDFTNPVTYTVTAEDGISVSTWTVTVNAPITPVVNLGLDTTMCAGSLTLDAGNSGSSYNWSDATSAQTLVVTSTGTYSVTVTSVDLCTTIDTINVTVNALPTVTLTSSNNVTICQGDSTSIDLSFTGTAPWSWIGDDGTGPVVFNAPTSPQSNPVNPSVTTTYNLISVTDANGCTNSSTISVLVNVSSVSVNLGLDANLCNGSSAILDAGNPGSTYLWNDGSTTQTITVNATGTYSVTVTNADLCSGIDSVNITVVTPATVTITDNAGTLTSDATLGNQWYEQVAGIVAGETNQTFTPTVSGNYYVIVTDSNGCTSMSNVISIIVGINEVSNSSFISIYPNPANEKVWIELTNNNKSNLILQITSVDGKVLFENNNLAINNKLYVYLKNYAKGIYFVKAISETNTVVKKLIVE